MYLLYLTQKLRWYLRFKLRMIPLWIAVLVPQRWRRAPPADDSLTLWLLEEIHEYKVAKAHNDRIDEFLDVIGCIILRKRVMSDNLWTIVMKELDGDIPPLADVKGPCLVSWRRKQIKRIRRVASIDTMRHDIDVFYAKLNSFDKQ